MICKYCGTETTAENGICKACSYKLKMSPNQEGIDIFSNSGVSKEDFERFEPRRVETDFVKEEETVRIADFAPEKPKKKKLRKSFVLMVIVALLIMVGALMYFLGVFDSGVGKIKDNLETGKYTEAVAVFQDKFTEEGTTALNKLLEIRLNELYEGYVTDSREYEDAKSELDAIEKMGVTELKKQVNSIGVKLNDMKESKTAFTKAENYYVKKNYALSIKEYEKVIKDDPNYTEANVRKAQAISNYRNTVLSEAATLVSGGNHKSAVKLLKSSLEILGEDKVISKRIKEYEKSEDTKSRQEIIDAADKHSFSEDYAAAITVLMTAIENNEEYSSDEIVMDSLEDYRKLYTEQFSEKIDGYIEEGRYEEAAELLEEADRVIPDSKTAEEKQQLLEGKMPQYLHELDADAQKKWSWGSGESVDSFGSDHSGAANYVLLSTKSAATYYIDGEYSSFKCSLVAAKEIDESVKCKVEITATVGGEYLYREVEISAETEAQEITMVTKDCSSLEISISGEGAKVLMYDARLIK